MTSFIVQAEDYVVTKAKAAVSDVEGVLVNDIDPLVEQFIVQFGTDFGKAALQLGASFVANIVNGTATIGTSIKPLFQTILNTGIEIAETDGLNIAGNALRVLVNGATTTPVVTAPATTAPVVATDDAQTTAS